LERAISGSEIANELGITRQAVSQTLKSSMKKCYKSILKHKFAESPYDAAVALMIFLKVDHGDDQDVKEFFGLFPKEIQKEIYDDAKTQFTY
jgi:predicted transcriptional regulator